MRRTYTPPPGYDGSRFVSQDGEVRAMEDGDYTLSVGGIPTKRGRSRAESERDTPDRSEERNSSRTQPRSRTSYYGGSSRRCSSQMPRRGVYSSRKPYPSDDPEEPFTKDEREEEITEEYVSDCEEEECDREMYCEEEPEYTERIEEDCAPPEHVVPKEEPCDPPRERGVIPLFSSIDSGDLLLILLIILLSGEKDTGNLVLMLAILLAIH